MILRHAEAEAHEPRPLIALPGRVNDDSPRFHQYLAEVLELVGGEPPAVPGPTDLDQYEWEHAARAAIVGGLPQIGSWPEAVFNALIRAIVHDPNPSFNRQLIEPALAAAGRRKVQEALLDLLSGGTNAEKAGAARASPGPTPTSTSGTGSSTKSDRHIQPSAAAGS